MKVIQKMKLQRNIKCFKMYKYVVDYDFITCKNSKIEIV